MHSLESSADQDEILLANICVDFFFLSLLEHQMVGEI